MDDFVGGVQLSNTKVQVLLFADDIVMVTERKEDIQRNLEVLKVAMDKWVIKMHLGKTKVMVVSRVEEGCSVTIDNETDVGVNIGHFDPISGVLISDDDYKTRQGSLN